MDKETYSRMLKDERWLAKRRNILVRDNYTCQSCGSNEKEMQVHHEFYLKGKAPWDYPDQVLVTLCRGCHEDEEHGRKNVYRDFTNAVADAGFTNDDIRKLTWTFRNIEVNPLHSGLLMSRIATSITSEWMRFQNWNPVFYDEDNDAIVAAIPGTEKAIRVKILTDQEEREEGLFNA